jgi:hypothetical protein
MSCLPLLAAGYFLLSVVSTGAADMMLSDKGNGEQLSGARVVRQMTPYCHSYGFTTSTVPATGPRESTASSQPAPRLLGSFLNFGKFVDVCPLDPQISLSKHT